MVARAFEVLEVCRSAESVKVSYPEVEKISAEYFAARRFRHVRPAMPSASDSVTVAYCYLLECVACC